MKYFLKSHVPGATSAVKSFGSGLKGAGALVALTLTPLLRTCQSAFQMQLPSTLSTRIQMCFLPETRQPLSNLNFILNHLFLLPVPVIEI